MPDAHKILLEVLEKYEDADKWKGSPFEHIKRLSNTKVGDIGQDFVERLCESLSIEIAFPEKIEGGRKRQSPWDIKIGELTFELKTATEDVSGSFQFNHIRYHREYDALLCVGISPSDIKFNVWTKGDVVTGKAGNLVTMEKGANASYKLTKKPSGLFIIDEFENRILELTTDPLA